MENGTPNLPVKRPSAVKRRRDERVRKRVRILRKSAGWLDERRYSHLLQRYGALSVIFDQLCENVRQHGLVNDLGEPRPILDSIRRTSATLLQYDRELLLTPLAGAQLHKRPRDIFENLMDLAPVDALVSKPDESAAVESAAVAPIAESNTEGGQ